MHSKTSKFLFLTIIAILVSTIISACATQPQSSSLSMIPLNKMPAEVQAAPSVVQQTYQFASANPDVMKHIPCYCGCGSMGHTSNYSCYVTSSDTNGKLTFGYHALGCSLCVNITQDAMRLLQQGKSVSEIKAYIDSTYSQYGTSNMP